GGLPPGVGLPSGAVHGCAAHDGDPRLAVGRRTKDGKCVIADDGLTRPALALTLRRDPPVVDRNVRAGQTKYPERGDGLRAVGVATSPDRLDRFCQGIERTVVTEAE